MSTRIVNPEEIKKVRENQNELMNFLYPDRLSDEEREQLYKEYLKRRKEYGQAHSMPGSI